MYPPFPIPGFAPNFTANQFGHANISWFEFAKSVGQQLEDAMEMVSNVIDVNLWLTTLAVLIAALLIDVAYCYT